MTNKQSEAERLLRARWPLIITAIASRDDEYARALRASTHWIESAREAASNLGIELVEAEERLAQIGLPGWEAKWDAGVLDARARAADERRALDARLDAYALHEGIKPFATALGYALSARQWLRETTKFYAARGSRSLQVVGDRGQEWYAESPDGRPSGVCDVVRTCLSDGAFNSHVQVPRRAGVDAEQLRRLVEAALKGI